VRSPTRPATPVTPANLELLGQVGEIVLGRGAYDEMAEAWSSSDSPVEEEIPERRRAATGDIVCFGGARFAHALARHRLIDEYRLTVHPVALGEGLPLWHGLPEPQRFASVYTTAYPDGAVTHVLAAKTEGES
jgi:riboflavin biosynthesis pyrimidine reductase